MEPKLSRFTTRRAVWFAGLAASLIVIVCVLSQCTMVGDRLTGVRVDPLKKGASSCLARCQDTAQKALKQESALHVSRAKACASDPQCLEGEEDRHETAIRSIQTARRDCMNGCHQQGGGGNG
jgi:hypothetical protein